MNEKITTLIIYHRVDLDGIFSGLIAKKAISEINPDSEIHLHGFNYGDPTDDIDFDGSDSVVLVDLSLPTDLMLKYKDKITWIDHHVTAINESTREGYSGIQGLRRDGVAACELTWEYFMKTKECPEIIKLAGTYDVFNKTRPGYDWENEVLPSQVGIKATLGGVSLWRAEEFWSEISENDPMFLEMVMTKGKTILDYLDFTQASHLKRFGFPVKVDGKYPGIAILSTEFGSGQFKSHPDYKDSVLVVANRRANGTYQISMYLDPECTLDFHAGEYMKKNYGGGGHKGAAGGNLTKSQFEKLIVDCEV